MRDVPELVDGYRRFLSGRYEEQAALYSALADKGQSPRVMVIACCDSRVDPAAIFDTGPGQLFVVRNVANLAPPYEPNGDYHGTSAALEFAVTGLEVETILVMGHALCGGVNAFLQGLGADPEGKTGFIDRWMSILNGAKGDLFRCPEDASPEERQRAMELAGVRCSIENLKSFPFIKERLDKGTLRLRGAYFGVADGKLLAMDPETGEFDTVE